MRQGITQFQVTIILQLFRPLLYLGPHPHPNPLPVRKERGINERVRTVTLFFTIEDMMGLKVIRYTLHVLFGEKQVILLI